MSLSYSMIPMCARRGATLLTTVLATVLTTAASGHAQTWVQRTPANSPSPRGEVCGTFDLARGETVIFGGRDRSGQGIPQTYRYDGTTWNLATPANTPSGRMRSRMAFDAGRSVSVMFGGTLDYTGATHLGDTWEWNGANWNQAITPNQPTQRHSPGMSYDLSRGVTVMFGGASPTGLLDDTWEFDGSDWVLRIPAVSPPAREWPAMAFDPTSGLTVLFGGEGAGGYLDDTWVWNGTNWTEVLTTHTPIGRKWHEIAFDFVTNQMVLHGGFRSGSRGDTWQFDGFDWVEVTTATGPITSNHALVYDLNRGVTVSFGGTNATGYLDETWEYASGYIANYSAFGAGCPGSGGTPTLAPAPGSVAALGALLRVDVTGLPLAAAATGMMFGFSRLPAPVDLSVIGMAGCVLQVNPSTTLPVAANNGVAIWQITMPIAPLFIGVDFFNQAATIDAGANALGVTLSNAGRAVLGV